MASKISKKKSLTIKGIINTTDDGIFIEVEDMDNPVNLSEYARDFDGEDVTLSITVTQEIV